MPYPTITATTITDLRLPNYAFVSEMTQELIELRRFRGRVTGEKFTLRLRYGDLSAQKVKLFIDFFKLQKSSLLGFTLPRSVFPTEDYLSNIVNELAEGCIWFFVGTPVVETRVSNLYNLTIRLRASVAILDAGISPTLINQRSYTLNGHTNLASNVVWEQITGRALAITDEDTLSPTISSVVPFNSTQGEIVLRLRLRDYPDIHSDVTIKTTPSSDLSGFSFIGSYAKDVMPNDYQPTGIYYLAAPDTQPIPTPATAPVNNPLVYDEPINLDNVWYSWGLPTGVPFTQLLKMRWLIADRKGGFVLLKSFKPEDERKINLLVGETYRLDFHYNYHGLTKITKSEPIFVSQRCITANLNVVYCLEQFTCPKLVQEWVIKKTGFSTVFLNLDDSLFSSLADPLATNLELALPGSNNGSFLTREDIVDSNIKRLGLDNNQSIFSENLDQGWYAIFSNTYNRLDLGGIIIG